MCRYAAEDENMTNSLKDIVSTVSRLKLLEMSNTLN